MSPQYTSFRPTFTANSRFPSTKVRKMQQMQQEDPRYRNLDRMLARAYIELLRKQKLSQQKAGTFVPRYGVMLTVCFASDNLLFVQDGPL